MINVTPAAVKQIHMAASDSAAEGMSLRVAAHIDERSGQMQYGIGFDEPRDDDDRVDTLGVTLLISPLSRDALSDLTIDYVEIEPGDFRFVFIAPREASAACAPTDGGCGSGRCSSGGCGSKS
jgi:iron-sulfur cluster assembly protein